jgi:hydrogenase/urease accessory protein HupE
MSSSQTTVQFAIDDLSIIECVDGIDVNGDYKLDANELAEGQAKVAKWIDRNLEVQINGQKESLIGTQLSLDDELPFKNDFTFWDDKGYDVHSIPDVKIVTAKIVIDKISHGESITIADHFHESIPAQYGNFLNILNDGHLEVTTVLFQNLWSYTYKSSAQPSSSSNPATPAHANVDWLRFLKLGSNHILTGLDHLLFLLTLILLKMKLRDYAKIITSFTIAHSLTLALTVLGIIHLPSKFVETMIAVSIMYVAIENIFFSKNAKYRWTLTFFFGLIHGMGFADLLMEMHLPPSQIAISLLSFNLGIEITQLTLVALAFLLLWYWHKSRWYPSTFKIVNLFAIVTAIIWIIQRILA